MKLKELFPLMFFINLDSRVDRLNQAKSEFKKLKISPERISGKLFTGTDNPSANGIMGCTLSHLECLKLARERGQNVLIFEDDIKFVNDYKRTIELACNEIEDYEWDMFYLGANILKPFYQVSQHLARLTHGQSTHAYGVNVKFIDTLINTIPENTIYPLDLIYSNYVIPSRECYIVAPKMVAVQRDSFSDIERTTANYESYLEKRYQNNFLPLTK